jgi:DnaJ-class molecular chaperone
MSRPTCTRCQGSGEGWHADQRCTRCGGSGEEPEEFEEVEPFERLSLLGAHTFF